MEETTKQVKINRPISIVLMIITAILGSLLALVLMMDRFDFDDSRYFVLLLGVVAVLHIATLVGFIASYKFQKKWSLPLSTAYLIFLNLLFCLSPLAITGTETWFRNTRFVYIDGFEHAFSFMAIVPLLLSTVLPAFISNATYLSKVTDVNDKAFFIKLNVTPTERDNFLARFGCAIASLAMAVSFTLPFLSINVFDYSYRFSLADFRLTYIDTLLESFPEIANTISEGAIYSVILSFSMLAFYVGVLFFASFERSKEVKVSLGLTVAISMALIVFTTRAVLSYHIESALEGIRAEPLGIGNLLIDTVGGVFSSVFSFDVGVWVMIAALVLYIVFAACQFSRFKTPSVIVQTNTTEVVKVRCQKCSTLNEDTSAFCSGCGEPIKKVADVAAGHSVCADCEAELPENAKFCLKCGKDSTVQDNQ